MQDVLILINGHRISDNMTSSNGPDWISLDYVKQIELVRGPGSAIYGGNAFSGAINIVTKSGVEGNINDIIVRLGNGNDFRSIGQRINNAYKMFMRVYDHEMLKETHPIRHEQLPIMLAFMAIHGGGMKRDGGVAFSILALPWNVGLLSTQGQGRKFSRNGLPLRNYRCLRRTLPGE